MITVVNKYKTQEPYVYIGRGSVFGNPFPITATADRDTVCDQYEQYFQEQIQNPDSAISQGLEQLKARLEAGEHLRLGCFCAPQRCHGETIKRHLEQEQKVPTQSLTLSKSSGATAMQTFTGYQYIKLDVANNFGLDKELFEDRLVWVDQHMDELESLMDQADEPILYIKAVRVLRDAQAGKPSGHLMAFDACASGLQIMGTLIGCETTCRNTGLIDPSVRADIYTQTTEVMNQLLHQEGIQVDVERKDVKQALMTMFYGSKMKPIEIFGDGTPELQAFYKAAEIVAPGACELMEAILGAWQPFALAHEWTLPDGFQARVKVMEAVDVKVEVDELDHSTFTHRFYENQGSKTGISLLANIVHSIDGMVVREMNRRCNYDQKQLLRCYDLVCSALHGEDPVAVDTRDFLSLVFVEHLTPQSIQDLDRSTLQRMQALLERTLARKSFPIVCIHDAFKCHPNNMNLLRQTYVEIFVELAQSYLIEDLLNQITGDNGTLTKFVPDLYKQIQHANYALS